VRNTPNSGEKDTANPAVEEMFSLTNKAKCDWCGKNIRRYKKERSELRISTDFIHENILFRCCSSYFALFKTK
jgi:hypothetical protein